MMIPFFILLSVLKSVTSSECESQLARESYACCIKPDDITNKGLTNCSFSTREAECGAGEYWATGNKDCHQFLALTVEDWSGLYCKGVVSREGDTGVVTRPSIAIGGKREDPSTYNDNTYLWFCSKPPPPAKQAAVIFDPPAGNISVTTNKIVLDITLKNGFPKAYSIVELTDGTQLGCMNLKRSTDESGLVSRSCKYQITLWSRETFFTVTVLQEGFANKTFQYRATTTVFPSEDQLSEGDRIKKDSFCFIFSVFCFYYVIA